MATAPKLAFEYIVLVCVLTDPAPLCQSGWRRGGASLARGVPPQLSLRMSVFVTWCHLG